MLKHLFILTLLFVGLFAVNVETINYNLDNASVFDQVIIDSSIIEVKSDYNNKQFSDYFAYNSVEPENYLISKNSKDSNYKTKYLYYEPIAFLLYSQNKEGHINESMFSDQLQVYIQRVEYNLIC